MENVNAVLLTILSLMVGFSIGNAFGKETMKRLLSEFINQMITGLKNVSEQKVNKE